MASTTAAPPVYQRTATERVWKAAVLYIDELERDLALAESRIEQLERQLIGAGVLDPELVP